MSQYGSIKEWLDKLHWEAESRFKARYSRLHFELAGESLPVESTSERHMLVSRAAYALCGDPYTSWPSLVDWTYEEIEFLARFATSEPPADSAELHEKALLAAKGKAIASIRLDPEYNDGDGGLIIGLVDGSRFAVYDNARQSCESRYMTTDDDLSAFIGTTFLGCEIRDSTVTVGPTSCDYHEVQFLHVKTSRGVIVCETHNDHNGYYGGFNLRVKKMTMT